MGWGETSCFRSRLSRAGRGGLAEAAFVGVEQTPGHDGAAKTRSGWADDEVPERMVKIQAARVFAFRSTGARKKYGGDDLTGDPGGQGQDAARPQAPRHLRWVVVLRHAGLAVRDGHRRTKRGGLRRREARAG